MSVFILDSNIVSLEDADILTAAFCKAHGFTLVTNNTRHFERITGLHYCDWI